MNYNNLKVGNSVDLLIKSELNEVHVRGKIVFTNSVYDFKYANMSEQITKNFKGGINFDEWDEHAKLIDDIDSKWGDTNEKYNCKTLIIEQKENYLVVALIFRKDNKSLFCCLPYINNDLLSVNNLCLGNWFYVVSKTIEKFINMNLEKENQLKLTYLHNHYKCIDINNLAKTESEDLIVFDIETKQFCKNFIKYQKIKDEKIKLYYPDIRVICCIFIINNVAYEKVFCADEVGDFLKLLRKFKKVISFNGVNFDFPVVQKNLGYKHPVKYPGTHFDILEELYKKTNKRFSLDSLVRLNIFTKKMVNGRDMGALNLEDLTKACLSDVRQTYLIYRLLKSNSLLLPTSFNNHELFAQSYNQLPTTNNLNCELCENQVIKINDLKSSFAENYSLSACVNCLTVRVYDRKL